MLQTTRRKIKKWSIRLFWLAVVALVVGANYNRFYHNNYANYEKAVDYGRVREDKEVMRPVVSAVFYQQEKRKDKSLSGYLNHWDSARLQNPKMLIVPKQLTDESRRVIGKLYKEIKRAAEIESVLLIHDATVNKAEHAKLLKKILGAEVRNLLFSEQDAGQDTKLDEFLQNKGSLVVFTADLNETEQDKFLIDEAMYAAQRHFYKIRIFDEVDRQLARALEDNYASWFESANEVNELQRQQNNLREYVNHYGQDILQYFIMNLDLDEDKSAVWPDKTPETYRLFDRGVVYIRFFGSGNKEVFSRAKIGKNKGIIVAVVELARKAVAKRIRPITAYKIYLLTELEKIEKERNAPLVNYLETDDGIYVQYRGRSALMAADERPENEAELAVAIRTRAKIPDEATDEDIEFYRFKTVEMEHEN